MQWTDFRSTVLDRRDPPILVFVFEPTVDWGVALFQRPQHMAMALGRRGCIVLYRTTGDEVNGVKQIALNVWLVGTPQVEELRGVIWCIYSTASLCSAGQMEARQVNGQVVYEYIDHIDSAISGSKAEVRRLSALKSAACAGHADYLIASAKRLYNELSKCSGGAPLAYIPNGVDVAHFRSSRHVETILPDHYRQFCRRHHRIVGYFGAIARWLWFDMIDRLSEELPDVGFVFIGPDYSDCVGKLPRRSNVLYLHAVAYEILPAYGRCFDVCFIPFAPGSIAETTSPLKLFEYFALAKPVVVTADMHECTAYSEVYSGSDVPSFIAAINSAFSAGQSFKYQEAVLRLAYVNTWDARAEAYLKLVTQYTAPAVL